ncbi:MAG: hypothetical protein K6E84_07315 [Lachnospiraceae bacterium]|nr:hypothetical protein [Lachnospiraceae bacterium]
MAINEKININALSDDMLDGVAGGVLNDQTTLMGYLNLVKGFGMTKEQVLGMLDDDAAWKANYTKFCTEESDRDLVRQFVNDNWG